ncbi:MAG: hypothetical protein ACTHPS_21100, partial [Streptosporangiaceae bacterium]
MPTAPEYGATREPPSPRPARDRSTKVSGQRRRGSAGSAGEGQRAAQARVSGQRRRGSAGSAGEGQRA